MPYKDPVDKANRRRMRERARQEGLKQEVLFELAEGGPGEDLDWWEFAEAIKEWSEANLKVWSGPLAGEPFMIYDYELEFLREAFRPGVRDAALCVGRKNGKSSVIAVVLLAFLAGPLNRSGWRCAVASMTGELAAELREHIQQTVTASGLKGVEVFKSPSPGRVEGQMNTRVSILAADKATGHAIGADLVIIDEAGKMPENRRQLWNNLRSCVSGRNGRVFYISARYDCTMFEELRSSANKITSVLWQEHSATEGCSLDDETQWHAANPGLKYGVKSLEYMKDRAEFVMNNPGDENDFREQDLNQRVDSSIDPVLTIAQYVAGARDELPERKGDCFVGVDVGGAAAMTAAAAYWPETGRCEHWGAFPADPDLLKRGEGDGVGDAYARMHDEGNLMTFPGLVTPVGEFLDWLSGELWSERVVMMCADKYKRAEVRQGIADAEMRWPVRWRGYKEEAITDLRLLQRSVIASRTVYRDTALLREGLRQSQVVFDRDGRNGVIGPKRRRSRIDVITAWTKCVAPAEEMRRHRKQNAGVLLGVIGGR